MSAEAALVARAAHAAADEMEREAAADEARGVDPLTSRRIAMAFRKFGAGITERLATESDLLRERS